MATTCAAATSPIDAEIAVLSPGQSAVPSRWLVRYRRSRNVPGLTPQIQSHKLHLNAAGLPARPQYLPRASALCPNPPLVRGISPPDSSSDLVQWRRVPCRDQYSRSLRESSASFRSEAWSGFDVDDQKTPEYSSVECYCDLGLR